MAGTDGFTDALDYPMYVVTASAGNDRSGCLVGFASQCSIDPLRFVVWLSTANHTCRVAHRATHLAVHVLRSDRKGTAAWFGERTGDDTDTFAGVDWRPGPGGAPVLADSCAWFVGRIVGRVGGGDHVGFLLAPVEQGPPDTVRPPLLRFGDVVDLTPGHPA
ncbi:flavin reductase family protein [Streptomyces sp. NPDC001744]|uniref:flavin reductase family protein n=1 Tax=Streptomyces sp. NPDC001744 TaxID=3364606 RepID=UPI0036BE4537